MEKFISCSVPFFTTTPKTSSKHLQSPTSSPLTITFPNNKLFFHFTPLHSSSSLSSSKSCSASLSTRTRARARARAATPTTPTTCTPLSSSNANSNTQQRHWMVLTKAPPEDFSSKPQIIDYYVNTLARVLGSEKDAQMCIYNASCDTNFGFCCDIDEAAAHELAGLPGVRSVRPDPDYNSTEKDYDYFKIDCNGSAELDTGSSLLFPAETIKHWLVRTDKPAAGVVTKAQAVDYFVQILTWVLGNEKDAQMCIYHVSWQSNYGFCCELDEECAKELAGVPGVLAVSQDEKVGSDDKDYQGQTIKTRTKKLFVTGLSFYTSEKTLRAAFEGFGELVEVKIIMDKISKRSKGYAFVEYTTEDSASTALREMNGKIINGWMITVDVAKKSPPKYAGGRPRPST